MRDNQTADQRCIISMAPPTRAQQGFAACVALLLIAAVILTAPYARTRLDGTAEYLAVYATVVTINDLITSAMLLAVFAVQCSRALLVVAMAYLFTGLTIIPWVLTFPDAQSGGGLLGAGMQTTAIISAARIYGFPLFVIVYALMKGQTNGTEMAVRPIRTTIAASVVAVLVLVCGLTWLSVAGTDLFPPLMVSGAQTAPLWDKVLALGMLVSLTALLLLLVRRRSALDLWLSVVLLTTLLENLLLGFLSSGRLSVGWWAGRIYGLASASVVLFVLLSEMTILYARLVNSVSSERRAREARLLAMEALSASVAHEINQPLASMVTNAEAGLRWLDRPSPDLDEAKSALRRIAGDGNRASDVISNIRTVFKQGTTDRMPIGMNEVIAGVLQRMSPQIDRESIILTIDPDAGLPMVMGNPIQLQQLISNLVTNAVEAMRTTNPELRSIRLRTGRQGSDFILVSIEDSGEGLDPQHRSRVFETVFTTKQHGSGMGLVISRTIVEAHGGQIWLENRKRGGAVCRFTLRAIV